VALAKGEVSVAVVHLDQACRNTPDDPRRRLRYAKLLIDARRFASAEEASGEAIRLLPKSAEAYALRGQARVGLERLQDADRDVQQALALDPQQPRARKLQEEIARKVRVKPPPGPGPGPGRPQPPQPVGQDAHKRNHALLSQVKGLLASDPSRATQGLAESMKLEPSPTCARLLTQRIELAMSLRQHRVATHDLALLTQAAGGDPSVDRLAVRVHAGTGNHAEALALADRILQRDPNDFEVLELRAGLREGRGELEASLDDYTRAVDLSGARLDARHRRAHLLFKLERFEESLADTDLLCQREPQNAHYLRMRGDVLEKLGRVEAAKEAYREALAQPGGKASDQQHARSQLERLGGS
jgi:tetratricopeptide (TPR) repeat protein